MNPRTTALLALAVALLGAFVWFYEIRGGEERAEQAAHAKRIFQDVRAEDIGSITLRTEDGQEARLERADGAWRLVEPLEFPADTMSVDGIASALASLAAEATLEDESVPLAEYGLDGPPKVRFRAGERELALRVGDKAPVGSNTYVATAEDRPVRVVPSYSLTQLDQKLDDLRDKRPLRFDREAVVELRVRWPDGGVRLVRDDQDPELWRMVEPVEALADGRNVGKALSDLEFLRSSGFDDAPSEEVGARLERPELSVEIRTRADGKEDSVRFALGAAGEDGERPARGNVSDAVYRMPAGSLSDFPRSVDAYRNKQLARFDPGEARRIELAFHGEGATRLVTGRLADGAWTTEPDAMKEGSVDALVRALSGLEGVKILAESADDERAAAFGLAPPRALFRVYGGPEPDSDELLAEVQLGELDAKRGIPARRPDRPTVFAIPAERAEQLPVSAEALQERFLQPPPEPEAAEAEPAPEPEAGADAAEPKPATDSEPEAE